MTSRVLPTIQRSCGPCSACCTIMGVAELGKAQGERCSHLSGGRCGIYSDRPASCRSFACLWLLGIGPPNLRPDKAKAMMTMNKTGNVLVVHETQRGAARRAPLDSFLRSRVDLGVTVYVIHPGADRTVWTRGGPILVRGVPSAAPAEPGGNGL